jgi:hypothetical protein
MPIVGQAVPLPGITTHAATRSRAGWPDWKVPQRRIYQVGRSSRANVIADGD